MISPESSMILDKIHALSQKIDSFSCSYPSTEGISYCSEQINELATALAKAQAKMPIAGRYSDNPYFKSKYADLAEVVRVSRGPLTENGLTVIQIPIENDKGLILVSRLQHSSGQYISSSVRLKPIKTDIQALASYLSYWKRYAYSCLVGVVSSDEDDDGERAVREESRKVIMSDELQDTHRRSTYETITREQEQHLEYELGEHDDISHELLTSYNVSKLAYLPKEKFMTILNIVRNNKQAKLGK